MPWAISYTAPFFFGMAGNRSVESVAICATLRLKPSACDSKRFYNETEKGPNTETQVVPEALVRFLR